ncbi:glycosyltransferase 87 family protein [Nocardioides ultimimeridianus]
MLDVRRPPTRTAARTLLVGAVGCQLVLTAALYAGPHAGLDIPRAGILQPLNAVPFAVAILALARSGISRRTTAILVVAVTAALQLLALAQPPLTSNDDLRYLWDGKVQLAGVDPYRYAPDDPALAGLHEPGLFADPGQDGCALPIGCALLNRPTVHTVYPPVAQGAFDLIRIVTFGGHAAYDGQQAFQVAAALAVVLLTLLLLRRCRRRGDPAWWPALWGWCPVVVSELGNNAHIDWVAILLCYAALGAYAAARPVWAGALVGAAVATKIYPLLIGPALLRRHPAKVVAAAAAVGIAGYLPHVAAVGTQVIGYLPGYLHEEGYANGNRLTLVGLLAPHPFDSVLGALLMAAAGWWCWRRTDPDRPEIAAVWLVGVGFLVFTPGYGWYAALLVALVAMTGRWYWLPVALAPTCAYLYARSAPASAAMYGAALAGSLVCWWAWRRAHPEDPRGCGMLAT